jgi:hypothetical protein
MRRQALLVALSAVVSAGAILLGQPPVRRATNIAALLAHPGFYHLRPISVAGNLAVGDDDRLLLTTDEGSIPVLVRDGAPPDGLCEIRGEYWDIGRMNPDDPRLAVHDLRATFRFDPEGPWPRPGQVTALVADSIVPMATPAAPSLRSLVLHPARYQDQTVTITGQFSGRNLLGDLPDTPANSPFDFVLRSADAAVWISHLQPRGRDFDLALDARVDTGRWLEVTGVLQRGRGLQWIDGSEGRIALAKPPSDVVAAAAPARVPAGPPPEVLFSIPVDEEIAVSTGTNVRIQFSRNVDPATLEGRVRASYQPSRGAQAADDLIEISIDYRPATRVLEVTFIAGLEPFSIVQIDLLEGILGTDEQPLADWTLRFTTGGG